MNLPYNSRTIALEWTAAKATGDLGIYFTGAKSSSKYDDF